MSENMDDQDNRLRQEYLASKWKSGMASAEEQKELFDWLNLQEELNIPLQGSFAQNEEQLKQRIFSNIAQGIRETPVAQRSVIRIRTWVTAASLTIFFGFGWFYFHKSGALRDNDLVITKDISAGKRSATLTLANGKKIRLSEVSERQLASAAGTGLSKTNEGKLVYHPAEAVTIGYNTLGTANGEQYEVILPDQTKVLLNAASSIRYPVSFKGMPQRLVELTGEAYFEVSKDADHPFLVETAQQTVRVLGTHFDINAYGDEPVTRTILTEGSVRINLPHKDSSPETTMTLKPGEQAVLQAGDLKLSQADLESGLAWVKGDFVFNEESLQSAMRRIARWYDVKIIYTAPIPTGAGIGGALSRSRPISAVLERIQKAAHVKIRVEGKNIYVSP